MKPTESITVFFDGTAEIVTIYAKYDGYPDGYGQDLAEIILDSAADFGTLAVQVISQLNAESEEIRLLPLGSSIGWQGYLYVVSVSDNTDNNLNIRIERAGTILFAGNASDCLEFCISQA